MNRLIFLGLLISMTAFLAQIISWEPVLQDGWYFLEMPNRDLYSYLRFAVFIS